MFVTVIVFLIVLSVLVIVHELGHFLVARWAKIGILEFALGLPFTKPLYSRKLSSGLTLSVYPLLFGGFVKLLGEEGQGSGIRNQELGAQGRHFYNSPVWTRVGVVVAGVVMNLFLAVVLFYVFLGLSGFKVLIPKLADYRFLSPTQSRVVVTYVQEKSPAEAGGISVGDVLLSVDGENFESMGEFQNYVRFRAGREIELSLADLELTGSRIVRVIPRINPPEGQGPLGVGLGEGMVLTYQTLPEKVLAGSLYSVDMLGYNLKVLAHLGNQTFQTRNIEPLSENVSGPVGIAGAVGTILGLGGSKAFLGMLNFVGLLSLSLAFMNVLPIPALDGGRLAFLLVEAFFGKKLAANRENLINQIGMAALLGLIALISFSDLKKVFGR